MCAYRDHIERVFVEALDAKIFDGSPQDFGDIFGRENHIRAGVIWTLKWAVEYCHESGLDGPISAEELEKLILLGRTYETFVDVLKYANYDLVKIEVDENLRIITCYEGGNVTSFDTQIVKHCRISTPATTHFSLTDNDDQLTSRWPAGDYRRVTNNLANYAANKESRIIVDPNILKLIGKSQISAPQPTVVWLERPNISPDCYVYDDIVLPNEINFQIKWKLVSLLETPIIMVENRYCTLSSDIKVLSRTDDYMLRLAARVDKRQYDLISGRREGRMIKVCENGLKHCSRPWMVQSRVRYTNPSQEADIIATRNDIKIVLQLKSTLRPETPWEVYKRNEDIIDGINHTKSLIERGIAEHGFVVTDGYRGDYMCWAKALTCGISIATLYDLEAITNDPISAASDIRSNIGVTNSFTISTESLPDREEDLLNWKLRLVDTIPPKELDR